MPGFLRDRAARPFAATSSGSAGHTPRPPVTRAPGARRGFQESATLGDHGRKRILTRCQRQVERSLRRGNRWSGGWPYLGVHKKLMASSPRSAPPGLRPWKTCRQAERLPLTRDGTGTWRKRESGGWSGRLPGRGRGFLGGKERKTARMEWSVWSWRKRRA